MPAVETFRFLGYTLRPTDDGDESLARVWTRDDPHHVMIDPRFWLEQSKYADSYMLEDSFGPVFFFKMKRSIEAHVVVFHVQFPPPDFYTPVRQAFRNSRVMTALILGLEWIERMLLFNDVRKIQFESTNPSLIRFCVRRLGFEQDGDTLTKRIAATATLGRGTVLCADQPASRKN